MSDKDKEIESLKAKLIKLAEIEQSLRTFGFLSYDEQTQKNEILKQYFTN